MALVAESGKLVLVVDDDESMRALLAHLVTQEGHRVETAADGLEGGKKAESLRPDLIVLDLMMPKYGGFELLRDLQGGELSRVPVFVVTGRYTDGSTREMIRGEANVVELMEKPIGPQAFQNVLRRILGPRPNAG